MRQYSLFFCAYRLISLFVCCRIPHQFISEMLAYTFTEIVNRLNTKLSAVEVAIPSFPLKPIFFSTDVSSKTMCFPALSSFSTLETSSEEIAKSITKNEIGGVISPFFVPYICSARTKNCKYNHAKYRSQRDEINHGYYRGWTFGQDREGGRNGGVE